jgi:hypothetical protein
MTSKVRRNLMPASQQVVDCGGGAGRGSNCPNQQPDIPAHPHEEITMTMLDTNARDETQRAGVTDEMLAELRALVDGPVLSGTDEAAPAETATFNLAVAHRPDVVVGATSADDVASAVAWAARHGLPIAVQGAAHGATTAVLGALFVSTARMTGVEIDPERRVARVGAGTRWAEVLNAAAPHGLAAVSGSSSAVGVVGYTLGGGMGPMSRQYGFGADRVRSFELVTADGRVHHVDEYSDPELFWAVRGGKGSFGIVTSMEIDLVPVSEIYGGAVFYAGSSARDVLHSFRTWSPTLPDRAGASIAMLRMPESPMLPPMLSGQFVVQLRFSFTGGEIEGAELLAPMLEAGEVLIQGVAAMPYSAADSIHQDPTEPMPVWEKGTLLCELGVETVETLLALAGPDADCPLAMVELRLMGGAIGRQPRVPNAVAGRDGAFSVLALGVPAPGVETVVPEAGTALIAALRPWSTGTMLLNWLGDADADEVARAWTPDTYARLLSVKQRLDPTDRFRYGHAVRVRP